MACKYNRLLSVEAQAQSSSSISPFITHSCSPVYPNTLALFSLHPSSPVRFAELIESDSWKLQRHQVWRRRGWTSQGAPMSFRRGGQSCGSSSICWQQRWNRHHFSLDLLKRQRTRSQFIQFPPLTPPNICWRALTDVTCFDLPYNYCQMQSHATPLPI